MHEQSVGRSIDGGEVNTYGRNTWSPGQPLPLLYGFEKPVYASPEEATRAAILRSMMEDRRAPGGPMDRSTPSSLQPLPGAQPIDPSGIMKLLQILFQIRQSIM